MATQQHAPLAPAATHQPQPMLWPLAPQPDIVRAAQKDALYLDHVLEVLQDAVMRTLGPLPALQWARESRLLSSALYYALTTGAGLQTLGEEYCDILQLAGRPPTGAAAATAGAAAAAAAAAAAGGSGGGGGRVFDARGPVGPAARAALSLLQALGPYAGERLAAALSRAQGGGGLDGWGDDEPWGWEQQRRGGRGGGGDDETASSSSSGSSSRGDGGDDGEQSTSGGLKPDSTGPGPSGSSTSSNGWAAAVRRWWRRQRRRRRRELAALDRARTALADRLPQLAELSVAAGRIHLALFYLYGTFYQWEKRAVGVTYTSVSPFTERRVSYRVLGWMLVAQLAITATLQLPQLTKGLQPAGGPGDGAAGPGLAGALQGQHAVLLPDVPPAGAAAAAQALGEGEGRPQAAATSSRAPLVVGRAGRTCPLCLSTRSNPACTPCGHVFCWRCIAQWCNEKPECPLCRAAVISPQLVCLYHSDF